MYIYIYICIYIYIYIYICYLFFEGSRDVMDIVMGNGNSDSSLFAFHIALLTLGKVCI